MKQSHVRRCGNPPLGGMVYTSVGPSYSARNRLIVSPYKMRVYRMGLGKDLGALLPLVRWLHLLERRGLS